MALEKVSGIFYEILIRGISTPKDGKKLGDFSGAHMIEAEAIVDTETGEVIQFRPCDAKPLDRNKIAGYLGDRFVQFDENLRAAQANEQEAIEARDAAFAERDALVKAANAERDEAIKSLDDALSRLKIAAEALAG